MTKVSSLPISCEARAAALTTARASPLPRCEADVETSSTCPTAIPPEHPGTGDNLVALADREPAPADGRLEATVELAELIGESLVAGKELERDLPPARRHVGERGLADVGVRRERDVAQRHQHEANLLEPGAPEPWPQLVGDVLVRHDHRAVGKARLTGEVDGLGAGLGPSVRPLGAEVARVPDPGQLRGHERGAQAPFADLGGRILVDPRHEGEGTLELRPLGLHAREATTTLDIRPQP